MHEQNYKNYFCFVKFMKKGVYLFLLLILLPTVSATITIEGPTNSLYNIGDKAHVTGYITATKDTFGLFKIDLNFSLLSKNKCLFSML